MSEPTPPLSALAAKLNDLDLIEAWLLIPTDTDRSPFEDAIAAELSMRYTKLDGREQQPMQMDNARPRLYAGW
jgi:hypothetical protein